MVTMRKRIGRRGRTDRRLLLPILGVVLLAGSNNAPAAWTLTLVNQTGRTLTFFDVNASPPPSRLQGGTLSNGGNSAIDPTGFNPVLAWEAGVSLTGTNANGFFIGLDLAGTPPRIQYKRFHYKVLPGLAGSDPSLQPILLDQQIVELTEGDITIVVDSGWVATIGPAGGPGACCAPLGGCTAAASTSACASGTFVPGISCTPDPCSSTTTTIGPGGGTVETPDGAVKITFPEDCVSSPTEITISEGDWPSRMYDIDLGSGPGAGFSVHVSYNFDPGLLDFCPEAELCITFDRTALGLSPSDCDSLQFVHQDEVCTSGAADRLNEPCDSDAMCGVTGVCGLRFHAHAVSSVACPASSSMGTVCANIQHFSEYGMVTEFVTIPYFWWGLIAVLFTFLIVGPKIYFRWRNAPK